MDNQDIKIKRLSIGEASEYLGVSIDTLRRWEKKDKITALRSPGGHRYFKQEDLDNLFGRKYEREKEKAPRKIDIPPKQEEESITHPEPVSIQTTNDREPREIKIPPLSPIRVIKEKPTPIHTQTQFQHPQRTSPTIQTQQSVLTPPAINTQAQAKPISSVPPTAAYEKESVRKKSNAWIYLIAGLVILIIGFTVFIIFRSPAEVLSPVP